MSVRPREATLAELVAAARGHTIPDRALLARAHAGHAAVDRGADPALTLALVVWPTENVTAVLEGVQARGSGRGVTASSA